MKKIDIADFHKDIT